jgi:D-alanyl-D-alanine carboxypeptidase (penicillin-binding protein 5/6)
MGQEVKKKKLRICIFVPFLLIVVIAAFVYKSIIASENHQHKFDKGYVDRTMSVPSPDIEPDPSIFISANKLNSPNAILVRLKDYAIMMKKNSQKKIYPASLTKIMTAVVAIEKLPDLKVKIKLTNSTFQGLYEANASMTGFQPGEEVTAIDLLYGALLPSGAESYWACRSNCRFRTGLRGDDE